MQKNAFFKSLFILVLHFTHPSSVLASFSINALCLRYGLPSEMYFRSWVHGQRAVCIEVNESSAVEYPSIRVSNLKTWNLKLEAAEPLYQQ